MIKRLHLQFTFFCTLITSLILVSMSLLCLSVIESQSKAGSFGAFQNNINSVLTHLEGQSVLTHQWLLQMESGYGLRLAIQDNGVPLFFDSLKQEGRITDAFRQAERTAKDGYGLDLQNPSPSATLTSHQEFSMTAADGEALLRLGGVGTQVPWEPVRDSLYPLRAEQARLWQQRLVFLGADILAILLLGIFSFFFTRRMLHPIRESKQRQVQFIASASHELRSPLTVILSSLSAMQIAPPSQAKRFADVIQDEGRRMARLIDDMLALANADNHSWTIHPSPIELDTLLLQTYEKYESVAAKKGLSFDVELPQAECLPICGDGERLAQVLAILIDNAFSYTPKGGRIRLSLRKSGDGAQIQVSDNGPGIPDDQKEAIFERFYRGDASHRDKAHFGLGLCIAMEIVRLHRGSLEVLDTPGGGATFLLSLKTH